MEFTASYYIDNNVYYGFGDEFETYMRDEIGEKNYVSADPGFASDLAAQTGYENAKVFVPTNTALFSNAKTLEGHVVAWSDRIAYINHDIDDAVRAGVIKNEDIPDRYRQAFGEYHSKRINSMIMDVVDNSFGKDFVSPSDRTKEDIAGLREWMFENVYRSPLAKSEEHKAVDMIKYLYEYFYKNFHLIPEEIRNNVGSKEQKVCDHISMMSDQYAVRVYEDITIPKSWSKL